MTLTKHLIILLFLIALVSSIETKPGGKHELRTTNAKSTKASTSNCSNSRSEATP